MPRTVSELVDGRVLMLGALCGLFAAGCIGPEGGRGGVDPWEVDETLHGSISVSVLTTGATIDTDGYVAELDEATSSPIPVNGETGFSPIATGYYSVRLADVDPPCSVLGTHPFPLYVFPDTTVNAHFDVDCP